MKNTTRGFGIGAVIGIVALLAAIGGGIYVATSDGPSDDVSNETEIAEDSMMMEKDGEAMEDSMMEHGGDAMDKEEGAMMKKDSSDTMGDSMDSMMHEGEAMMEHDGDSAMMKKEDGAMEAMMEETVSQAPEFTGTIISGGESPLIDFNQEDYEKAIESDKLVVLYFYASWCPLCKSETKNALHPAFDELSGSDVVGFQVNFNDSDTTKDEKKLASEHKVTTQHSKVFLKDGEQLLYTPHTWSKDQYLDEINKAL